MTDVKIFTDDIKETARKQVENIAASPAFSGCRIRIMPDVHAGKGCVVGTTMTLTGKVYANLVGADTGCLDRGSEVLTPEGWIKISDYSGQDILTYDFLNDTARFAQPYAYIKQPCDEFYHLKSSYGLDMMISKNHTMMYWAGYGPSNRKIVMTDAESFVEHHNRLTKGIAGGIKTTFGLTGQNPLPVTDDEIRVWTMISADGCLRDHKAKETVFRKEAIRTELHFSKTRKIERCKYLLEQCGYSYKITACRNGTTIITAYIPKFMTKSLKCFYKASAHQLGILAEESIKWDGYAAKDNNPNKHAFYSTTDRMNADVIQFAFACNGMRCGIFEFGNGKISENWSTEFNVYQTKNQFVNFPPSKFETEKSMDGFMYCFQTETGAFVMRRNNKIQISHNCGIPAAKMTKGFSSP